MIDDDLNLIYIHGRIGRFLEPAEGRISLNVLEMARPGLKAELSTAIRKASVYKKEIRQKRVQIKEDEGVILLDLVVKPIPEPMHTKPLMLLTFKEIPSVKVKERGKRSRSVKSAHHTVEDLSLELQETKEKLYATIEELETSNRALKSSNEALQSTNEELETSKEELQSLNEESATVNAELQSRVDELSKANDDMKNLLDSTEIATIFLDTELRIRSFTPKATDIMPLSGTDCGRPINHLASNLIDLDLAHCSEQVLRTLLSKEIEVRCKAGRYLLMRIQPYRTINNVIDGIVMTFEDVSRIKKAEALKQQGASELIKAYEALRCSKERLKEAQRVAKIGDWDWDLKTDTVTWSDEMYNIFGLSKLHYSPDSKSFPDLVHPGDRHLMSQEHFNQSMMKKHYDVEYRITDQRGHWVKLVCLRGENLFDEDGSPVQMKGTLQDITDRKKVKRGHMKS